MTGPLGGMRILDFTTLLPGPYGTMMLADMGAEVLRLEAPERFDLLRGLEPLQDGDSVAHMAVGRSKASMRLNLKTSEGVKIVHQLVAKYDILVEGFRPGVMEKLGVGYEDLKRTNPELIYVSLTGYGQTGPYRGRAGHDINYQALSGHAHYNGRRDSGPTPTGFPLADIAGGSCHLVMGLLAAVIHRHNTGEGQFVDVSMTDASFALNTIFGARGLAGALPEPERELLNGGSFYDFYKTRDGKFMAVGSLEPQYLQTLLDTLGGQDLFSIGYSKNRDDQVVLKEFLSQRFGEKSQAEWCSVFEDLDCCVEPVLNFEEVTRHPQIRARKMLVDVPKEAGGMQQQIAFPIKFSECDLSYNHVARKAGQDTEQVLASLGYQDVEIAALKKKRILG